MIRQVSVIGPGEDLCSAELYAFTKKLGKALVDLNCWIFCGGKGGIMEAVCAGARESSNYQKGRTIGILPGLDKKEANPYCDLVVPTALSMARNQLVVNAADIIIAVAGGAGTLSELAFAWQSGKKVICVTCFEGWAATLANREVDNRNQKLFFPADSVEQVIDILQQFYDT